MEKDLDNLLGIKYRNEIMTASSIKLKMTPAIPSPSKEEKVLENYLRRLGRYLSKVPKKIYYLSKKL